MRPELGVAVVGAGMAGRAHAHAYRSLGPLFPDLPRVRLVTVSDTNEGFAQDAQRRYEFDRHDASWQAVAEAEDVDVVSVTVPNHLHRDVVEGLLAAGKHVLCEKPLAPGPEDALAMLRASEQATGVSAVGFVLRAAPAIAAIRRRLQDGSLGEPRQFFGRYLTDYALDPDLPHSWRYTRAEAGGGAIVDVGSHIIDTARFLFGEIASVRGAATQTFVRQRPVAASQGLGHSAGAVTDEFREVDNDDVASFTATFEAGAVGEFGVSRMASGFKNSVAFTALCSKGSASFDFERAAEFEYHTEADDPDIAGFHRVVAGPHHPNLAAGLVMPVAGTGYGLADCFVFQAHAFVAAVADGDRSELPTFEDGYRAVKICDAVLRSADEGGSAVAIDHGQSATTTDD